MAVPLTELDVEVYEVKGKELTPTAVAYLRARQVSRCPLVEEKGGVSEAARG